MTITEMYEKSEWLTKNYSSLSIEEYRKQSQELSQATFPKIEEMTLTYSHEISTLYARSIVFFSNEQKYIACKKMWDSVVNSNDATLKGSYSSIIWAVVPMLDKEILKTMLFLDKINMKGSYPSAMCDVIRYLSKNY